MNKRFFKMIKLNNLTLSEEAVYAAIASYSYRGVSRVSRATIAEMAGIKKLDTVTKHTNKLEQLGLITKIYNSKENSKKSVSYRLNYKDEPFVIVNHLLAEELSGTELIFAIRLASIRYKDTPWIKLSKNEIIKMMNIGVYTFYEYMPKLIEKGIVLEVNDCYILNTNYFPIFQKLDDETIELIKCALNRDKTSVAYEAVSRAYSNGFIGISNPKAYVIKCLMAGTSTKDVVIPEKTNIKEYEF